MEYFNYKKWSKRGSNSDNRHHKSRHHQQIHGHNNHHNTIHQIKIKNINCH